MKVLLIEVYKNHRDKEAFIDGAFLNAVSLMLKRIPCACKVSKTKGRGQKLGLSLKK